MAQWWVVEQPWPVAHPTGLRATVLEASSRTAAKSQGGGAVFGGPFTSKAQAQASLNAQQQPGGDLAPSGSSTLKVPNPISGVTDFLQRLGQANTWIRVAEVALGLILIAVGVAKITHAVPIATKIAGAVA